MIVRDAIHGNIELTSSEVRLIKTKPFERLRHIKQLGFAEYTYPCATHNRLTHSIGVLQCITDMYNAICQNHPSFYRDGDIELLRLMALIHDLGHAPFSHASEELSDKEHEEWLTEILETLKKDIIIPNQYGIESWRLVNEVYQGIGRTYLGDKHLMALHSLMDGYIDADKLDYLERDAYHCGVRYGNFDRADLINSLTMIDGEVGILDIGLNALESFLLARYYMFSKVYTNPDERLRRMLYVSEMKDILPEGLYPSDVKKYIKTDDMRYISRLKFLDNPPYILLYDDKFNEELKSLIDLRLSDYLVCDCIHKSIFRQEDSDSNIMVLDSSFDTVRPCTELSPILEGIQYTSIHRMRYYAENSISKEVGDSLRKVVKSYYEG